MTYSTSPSQIQAFLTSLNLGGLSPLPFKAARPDAPPPYNNKQSLRLHVTYSNLVAREGGGRAVTYCEDIIREESDRLALYAASQRDEGEIFALVESILQPRL